MVDDTGIGVVEVVEEEVVVDGARLLVGWEVVVFGDTVVVGVGAVVALGVVVFGADVVVDGGLTVVVPLLSKIFKSINQKKLKGLLTKHVMIR